MMTDTCELRTEDGAPNVKAMQQQLQRAVELAVGRIEQDQLDESARYARWEHQQPDGRKPEQINGRPAEPWANASDTRCFLIDSIVVDQVATMKVAGRRARLTVQGREGADMGRAGKVQVYLDYLRNTRMADRVQAESERAANWRQTYGRAVMAVTWRQEWQRRFEEITLDQLQQLAAAQPGGPVAMLLAALHEPDREVTKQLAAMLVQMYPDLERGEAYRQLQALRDTGAMSLPARELVANEPQWEALMPWRDVFYPHNTEDLQAAPWVAWRCVLTEAQVYERVLSEDWSEDFVEAVLKTKGKSLLDTLATRTAESRRFGQLYADSREAMEGLCEVFYVYYQHVDAAGVPCRWRTVISPHAPRGEEEMPVGPDEALGYDHGLYPFVLLQRERAERQAERSRGVAEIARAPQNDAKRFRDNRIDQTELFLQPPVVRPEREVGLPLTIRPRGEIGERRAQSTRQWDIKHTAPAAEPLEMVAIRDADRYFARNRAEEPTRAALHEQVLVDDWCMELGACWRMTLQLAQQFETESMFARVVGGKPMAWRVTREEIQGSYDLQLRFNTDVLDPARMEAKVSLFQKIVLPMDRFGLLNMAPVVGGVAASLFPEFAEEMVQGQQQASQKEVEDEQKNWALMIAGEEPAMHEDGQNFQLRLQWLMQKLQQPGAQQRMQALPDTQELVKKRVQHLQFMLQQQTNAATGRVGVQAGPAQQG